VFILVKTLKAKEAPVSLVEEWPAPGKPTTPLRPPILQSANHQNFEQEVPVQFANQLTKQLFQSESARAAHNTLPPNQYTSKQPTHLSRVRFLAPSFVFQGMFLADTLVSRLLNILHFLLRRYALMGAAAYQYFGESCSVLVTHNLATSSSVAGWIFLKVGTIEVTLSQLLSALVALSTFSTISPLIFVLAELIIDMAQGTTNARASCRSCFLFTLYDFLPAYECASVGWVVRIH
jgi:hypothetical protein